MAPQKIGTLVVVVLKARNLPNPSLYKQSPYCLVRFGGGGQRTKEDVKGGQHPIWDEEIHFEIYDHDVAAGNASNILRVGIFTAGKRVDEKLGEGEIAINDVLKNGEFDDWVPLSLDGSQRGEVYLELTFFPAAKALARRPTKLSPNERLWRPLPSPPSTPPSGTPLGPARASGPPIFSPPPPPSTSPPPSRPALTSDSQLPQLPPRNRLSPQPQPQPQPRQPRPQPPTNGASPSGPASPRPFNLSPPPTSLPPPTTAGSPQLLGSIPYIPRSQPHSAFSYIVPPTSRPANPRAHLLGTTPLAPVPSLLRPGNQKYANPNSRDTTSTRATSTSPFSITSSNNVPARQQTNMTHLSSAFAAPPPAYDETPPAADSESPSSTGAYAYFPTTTLTMGTSEIDADARFAEDLQREEQERLRAQEASDAAFARSLMDEEERANGGVGSRP